MIFRHTLRTTVASLIIALACSGCVIGAVVDLAATVVVTTAKVGVAVVGTAVDVTTAGVKAVAGTSDKDKKKEDEKPVEKSAEKPDGK